MALPLKSGADLYNNQALRLRLHNLGADPTEVGAGLIYFNTSTGLNTSQKARLYTGSAWKTIAFSEDLDVASNADFLALKDKVDLLSGDVDTDAIISNMKEVSAFLEGFAEDASLMDYLNTELGKKLDKTGGTIEGGSNDVPLVLKSSGTTTWLKFSTNDGKNRYIGVGEDNTLKFQYGGASYPILHSGNVGEYAVKGLNIQTSSDNTRSLFSVWRGNTDADGGDGYVMDFNWNSGNYKAQIYIDVDPTHKMALRQCGNDGIWSDWKTIAFTDSDITGTAAKAKNLVDSEGKSVAYVSGNTFYIGDSIYPTTSTQILGKDVRFRYGANASFGFWLNESGNVTIGASDLAGTSAKLYVAGDIGGVEHLTFVGGWMEIGLVRNSSNAVQDLIIQANGGKFLSINPNGGNVGIGTTNPTEKLDIEGGIRVNGHIYPKWGNSTDLGKNSQRWNNIFAVKASFTEDVIIDGDLHVKGNIIADGEVSAGGRAEEGGNAGSGAGAFHSESIAVGATQTTIAHGLGTDDIVVSIYEKDGVSGRWSIILTDVEIVDANNIIVSFGSATTVEHKVVIMGAVA